MGGLDFEVAARSPATIGLAAADFLTLGPPLGFFAVDWAKPVMAKLNPNVSAIAVFFMISTSIVKPAPPKLSEVVRFV